MADRVDFARNPHNARQTFHDVLARPVFVQQQADAAEAYLHDLGQAQAQAQQAQVEGAQVQQAPAQGAQHQHAQGVQAIVVAAAANPPVLPADDMTDAVKAFSDEFESRAATAGLRVLSLVTGNPTVAALVDDAARGNLFRDFALQHICGATFSAAEFVCEDPATRPQGGPDQGQPGLFAQNVLTAAFKLLVRAVAAGVAYHCVFSPDCATIYGAGAPFDRRLTHVEEMDDRDVGVGSYSVIEVDRRMFVDRRQFVALGGMQRGVLLSAHENSIERPIRPRRVYIHNLPDRGLQNANRNDVNLERYIPGEVTVVNGQPIWGGPLGEWIRVVFHIKGSLAAAPRGSDGMERKLSHLFFLPLAHLLQRGIERFVEEHYGTTLSALFADAAEDADINVHANAGHSLHVSQRLCDMLAGGVDRLHRFDALEVAVFPVPGVADQVSELDVRFFLHVCATYMAKLPQRARCISASPYGYGFSDATLDAGIVRVFADYNRPTIYDTRTINAVFRLTIDPIARARAAINDASGAAAGIVGDLDANRGPQAAAVAGRVAAALGRVAAALETAAQNSDAAATTAQGHIVQPAQAGLNAQAAKAAAEAAAVAARQARDSARVTQDFALAGDFAAAAAEANRVVAAIVTAGQAVEATAALAVVGGGGAAAQGAAPGGGAAAPEVNFFKFCFHLGGHFQVRGEGLVRGHPAKTSLHQSLHNLEGIPLGVDRNLLADYEHVFPKNLCEGLINNVHALVHKQHGAISLRSTKDRRNPLQAEHCMSFTIGMMFVLDPAYHDGIKSDRWWRAKLARDLMALAFDFGAQAALAVRGFDVAAFVQAANRAAHAVAGHVGVVNYDAMAVAIMARLEQGLLAVQPAFVVANADTALRTLCNGAARALAIGRTPAPTGDAVAPVMLVAGLAGVPTEPLDEYTRLGQEIRGGGGGGGGRGQNVLAFNAAVGGVEGYAQRRAPPHPIPLHLVAPAVAENRALTLRARFVDGARPGEVLFERAARGVRGDEVAVVAVGGAAAAVGAGGAVPPGAPPAPPPFPPAAPAAPPPPAQGAPAAPAQPAPGAPAVPRPPPPQRRRQRQARMDEFLRRQRPRQDEDAE